MLNSPRQLHSSVEFLFITVQLVSSTRFRILSSSHEHQRTCQTVPPPSQVSLSNKAGHILDQGHQEDIQNPTQRHNCQKSGNPTHPAKSAHKSANPTHLSASDTVFRKSDTFAGSLTHTARLFQETRHTARLSWLPSQSITIDPLSSFLLPSHILAAATPRDGGTRGASDAPPRHSSGAVSG